MIKYRPLALCRRRHSPRASVDVPSLGQSHGAIPFSAQQAQVTNRTMFSAAVQQVHLLRIADDLDAHTVFLMLRNFGTLSPQHQRTSKRYFLSKWRLLTHPLQGCRSAAVTATHLKLMLIDQPSSSSSSAVSMTFRGAPY